MWARLRQYAAKADAAACEGRCSTLRRAMQLPAFFDAAVCVFCRSGLQE